jgi:hypothetical protein
MSESPISKIDCRLEVYLVPQEQLQDEKPQEVRSYTGKLIGDGVSPKYVLQESSDLADWIVVEGARIMNAVAREDWGFIRGTAHFRIYSDAIAVWNTLPWRLVAALGKMRMNIEVGFYLTQWPSSAEVPSPQ